jgi:starch phosphorylase
VQLLIAGKAHPHDAPGHAFVKQWAAFVRRPDVRLRAIFIEDYDMALAEELVQGVDVWINTPRRPWEASGTSGMKVLVNGGLNLSELDGWWAEAYSPDVGWALGDGEEHADAAEWDARETEQLFTLLEREVVPEFYDRDADGIPRAWVARIRASLSRLTPRFSSNRMLAEYLENFYRPAARAMARRAGRSQAVARELDRWRWTLRRYWPELRWGNLEIAGEGSDHVFRVQAYLGEIPPESVQVQMFAAGADGGPAEIHAMQRERPLPGSAGGYSYLARVPNRRPAQHYTPRVVPCHPDALVPLEANFIRWHPE